MEYTNIWYLQNKKLNINSFQNLNFFFFSLFSKTKISNFLKKKLATCSYFSTRFYEILQFKITFSIENLIMWIDINNESVKKKKKKIVFIYSPYSIITFEFECQCLFYVCTKKSFSRYRTYCSMYKK